MAVIKNISYFLFALVLSKPLGFILSFILAKALGPADFGVWITLVLLVSYSPIACLGTVEALVKKVPFHRGRNEHREIQELEDSIMGSVILAAFFILAVACVALLFLPDMLWGMDSHLTAVMLVAAATMFFSGFFYYRLSAYENFKAVGTLDFFRSVVALLFMGGLGWKWSLKGVVFGYLLHEASVCGLAIYFNVRTVGKVGWSFQKTRLISVVRIGFPITVLWWTLTLTGTVDRVVLGSMLGPLAVGHYGLGISLGSILGLIPMAVGRVLYPKVNMEFGKNVGAAAMKKIVLAPSLALGTLLANVQVVVLVVMPFLYNEFLPKYQLGLHAGQILILGGFFGCMLRNGDNFLIAANHETAFLKFIVLTLVFNIVADVSLVKAGLGIEGIALGTSLSALLLTTIVWRKVLVGLEFSGQQIWTSLLNLYLPGLLLIGIILVVHFTYPAAIHTFNWLTVVCGIFVVLLLNSLLFCHPVYREAMQSWAKRLLKMRNDYLMRRSPVGGRVG